MSNNPQLTATDEELNEKLKQLGISKTVYAWTMPEAHAVWNELLDRQREDINDMYTEAWTKKQDQAHVDFLQTWKGWTENVVDFQLDDFPYFYPTAGASEGLRQAIFAYAASCEKPRIHVFNGEYEGFAAYAKAAGIETITHDRDKWQDSIANIKAGEQFYISQPAAIDGMIWQEFDDFAKALAQQSPEAKIMLDLSYVGAVARPYKINASYDNIERIFFSLSKPMGVYYHRIGGCLSRNEDLGLFGNMWFKNLLALEYGKILMTQYGVRELPQKYQYLQQRAADLISQKIGQELQCCDVVLLATSPAKNGKSEQKTDLEKYLTRGTLPTSKPRYCLTPLMDQLSRQTPPKNAKRRSNTPNPKP